jgi:hypothetical protein
VFADGGLVAGVVLQGQRDPGARPDRLEVEGAEDGRVPLLVLKGNAVLRLHLHHLGVPFPRPAVPVGDPVHGGLPGAPDLLYPRHER